jgi:hypothetical protein
MSTTWATHGRGTPTTNATTTRSCARQREGQNVTLPANILCSGKVWAGGRYRRASGIPACLEKASPSDGLQREGRPGSLGTLARSAPRRTLCQNRNLRRTSEHHYGLWVPPPGSVSPIGPRPSSSPTILPQRGLYLLDRPPFYVSAVAAR